MSSFNLWSCEEMLCGERATCTPSLTLLVDGCGELLVPREFLFVSSVRFLWTGVWCAASLLEWRRLSQTASRVLFLTILWMSKNKSNVLLWMLILKGPKNKCIALLWILNLKQWECLKFVRSKFTYFYEDIKKDDKGIPENVFGSSRADWNFLGLSSDDWISKTAGSNIREGQ